MVKAVNYLPGPFRREIHQHVATEDHVHRVGVIGKRRIDIVGQIEKSEGDHLFDPGQDFKATAADLSEILLFQPHRSVAEGPFPKNAFGRLFQETRVDVGGQDG